MNSTGFRLYLNTNYYVAAWPFEYSWREIVTKPELSWPNAVRDFDIFLPEDMDNAAHGDIARQHPTVPTDMAIYRNGEALIVLMRLWDGTPLATRYAPPNEDGANLWIGSGSDADALVYVGANRRGEMLSQLHRHIRARESGDSARISPWDGNAQVAVGECEGGWVAAFRLSLTALPEYSEGQEQLIFTAGRIWGETFELTAWASATTWFPMLSLMGTLHLAPRKPRLPHLHRADLLYDAEAEQGELRLQLAGVAGGQEVPMKVTINTRQREYSVTDEVRLPFVPEDGNNAITVRVGDSAPITFHCEKWSGHRLFPRYPSADALPSLDELSERFAKAHARQERGYRGNGTWSSSTGYEAEEQETPRGHEGLDHNCAFPMEAYALACLYLERNETFEQRVREACDRMLREEQPGGYFLNYHFGEKTRPFVGGAFTQGSVGEALLLGYRVFGDERYLQSSQRAAKAYAEYSLEGNVNYMAFVLWHLSELYELTGDERELERAVWYARHGIIRGMNPSGAHPGHNYYSAYGDITLKGLAKLLRVLPQSHEFHDTLRERTLRYTNQMLSRQCADGSFGGRNRLYFGYRHLCNGLFEVLRALPEYSAELEPVLIRMVNTKFRDPAAGDPVSIKELALMARHIEEKNSQGVLHD